MGAGGRNRPQTVSAIPTKSGLLNPQYPRTWTAVLEGHAGGTGRMCPACYGEPRIAPSDSARVQKSERGNAPWFLFIVPSITPRPERPAPPPAARFCVPPNQGAAAHDCDRTADPSGNVLIQIRTPPSSSRLARGSAHSYTGGRAPGRLAITFACTPPEGRAFECRAVGLANGPRADSFSRAPGRGERFYGQPSRASGIKCLRKRRGALRGGRKETGSGGRALPLPEISQQRNHGVHPDWHG